MRSTGSGGLCIYKGNRLREHSQEVLNFDSGICVYTNWFESQKMHASANSRKRSLDHFDERYAHRDLYICIYLHPLHSGRLYFALENNMLTGTRNSKVVFVTALIVLDLTTVHLFFSYRARSIDYKASYFSKSASRY